MISSGLLYGLSPSTIGSPSKPKRLSYYPPGRNQCCNSVKCKGSSIVDYDLYELLGIDSSSNQQQIKNAYRSLQKQCHPDIAGPDGHDMSIILNEAYALLSNPNSRYVYDKEQAKMEDFRGYTGKPLYSTWFGSESEDRAVFVDEVKCVGCLKCALFAEKTFAVESVYGRARVVAQWADPDDKISDAIQSCPVDCISMVARSDLAALEFLMSKQPRGTVQMTAGNTGGKRVSNIFVDVNKFQSKYQKMRDKASGKDKSQSLSLFSSSVFFLLTTDRKDGRINRAVAGVRQQLSEIPPFSQPLEKDHCPFSRTLQREQGPVSTALCTSDLRCCLVTPQAVCPLAATSLHLVARC